MWRGGNRSRNGGGVIKAPGPLSSGAYHHPVHTVTLVWDVLCRKLKSKRNRRETEVTTRGWGEKLSACLV